MSQPWIDVLVPTCDRPAALAVTLATLGAQDWPRLRIVVADQSEGDSALGRPEVVAVLRYLRARGRKLLTWRHLPRRGMAEQRAFLLAQARSPYCLFVDDDVMLEPDLLTRLHRAIAEQGCGFVGSAVHGLSYHGQVRPQEECMDVWQGKLEPETVAPDSPAWERHRLHSAANLFHVQTRMRLAEKAGGVYRVAWVGGCVLFDTAKLRAAGGFDFWPQLPPDHCGEDVAAQLRVMARYGGCGIVPSGAYHMEMRTTVAQRRVDAARLLFAQGGGSGGEARLSGADAPTDSPHAAGRDAWTRR